MSSPAGCGEGRRLDCNKSRLVYLQQLDNWSVADRIWVSLMKSQSCLRKDEERFYRRCLLVFETACRDFRFQLYYLPLSHPLGPDEDGADGHQMAESARGGHRAPPPLFACDPQITHSKSDSGKTFLEEPEPTLQSTPVLQWPLCPPSDDLPHPAVLISAFHMKLSWELRNSPCFP